MQCDGEHSGAAEHPPEGYQAPEQAEARERGQPIGGRSSWQGRWCGQRPLDDWPR